MSQSPAKRCIPHSQLWMELREWKWG
jgi:hypothetical protein